MGDLIRRHGDKAAKTLAFCKERVERSRKFVQNERIATTRQAMIDLYRGHHRPVNIPDDQDYAVINVARAVIDTILPSVSMNNPVLSAEPRDERSIEAAGVAEAAGNYFFERFRYKDHLQLALLDSLVGGLGVVKVGWKLVEDEVERDPVDMEEDYSSAVEAADESAEGYPTAEGDAEIAKGVAMTERRVVADHPIVERVSPFDVFLDPDATNLLEVRWVAQRIFRPRHEIRSDKRYDREARLAVPSMSLGSDTHNDSYRDGRGTAQTDSSTELAVVWEMWDLREGTWCVFAEDGDRFLIRPQTSAYGFDSPFEFLAHTVIPEVLYPIGELESMETLQHELNRTRTDLMNHRAKFARKYVIDPDAFNEQAKALLQANVDNLVIEVEPGADLNRVFAQLPTGQTNPELYNADSAIIDNIMLVTGRNEYQMNAEQSRRRTATESSIVNDQARTRSEYRLQRYEEFVSRVAAKVVTLCKQYLTSEEVAKIDIDGAQFWLPFTGDDLVGEYSFSVKAGSTAPLSPAMRRREANDLAQAMAPFVASGVVNPAEVAKKILEAFGVRDVNKFIMAPGPMGPMGPMGQMGAGPLPQEAPQMSPRQAAEQGISPEEALRNQLSGQVGLNLPSPDMS